MLACCRYIQRRTTKYYRLSIYRGYIWYDSADNTTIIMVKLRSDLHSRRTPHTSPLLGCLSWVMQPNMTAIYRERIAWGILTCRKLNWAYRYATTNYAKGDEVCIMGIFRLYLGNELQFNHKLGVPDLSHYCSRTCRNMWNYWACSNNYF